MNSKWRPPDWRNPVTPHTAEYYLYETGASAIIPAVREATAQEIFEEIESYITARYYSPESGCDVVAICETEWQALREKYCGRMPEEVKDG